MVLVGGALPRLVCMRESQYPGTGGEVPVPAILGTVSPIFQRREDMLITREGNLVTLINVFETKPERQQELIDEWIRFTEEAKDEPGFIGAALHRNTDGARVINYTHWRHQSDFGYFLNNHDEQFKQLGERDSPV